MVTWYLLRDLKIEITLATLNHSGKVPSVKKCPKYCDKKGAKISLPKRKK